MRARALSVLTSLALTAGAAAQSTAFTYQGELKSDGQPASGLHDVRFKLFDAPTAGTQVGSTFCADNVQVNKAIRPTAVMTRMIFMMGGQVVGHHRLCSWLRAERSRTPPQRARLRG